MEWSKRIHFHNILFFLIKGLYVYFAFVLDPVEFFFLSIFLLWNTLWKVLWNKSLKCTNRNIYSCLIVMAPSSSTAEEVTCQRSCLVTAKKWIAWTSRMDWLSVDQETAQSGWEQMCYCQSLTSFVFIPVSHIYIKTLTFNKRSKRNHCNIITKIILTVKPSSWPCDAACMLCMHISQ